MFHNGFLKVATSSPKVSVGDPIANVEVMLKSLKVAQDHQAGVLVFPELSICGYTCGDLLFQTYLLQDVKKIGKKGDVIEASDGYARNFLFPRKLAQEATDANMHILNNKKENERKQKLAELEAAQKLAGELKGKEIKITAKTGENGKLFGAITSKDVAQLIKEQYKVDIDKKKIVMDTIKVAGNYEIDVKLYPEVSTKMKVIIVPQS